MQVRSRQHTHRCETAFRGRTERLLRRELKAADMPASTRCLPRMSAERSQPVLAEVVAESPVPLVQIDLSTQVCGRPSGEFFRQQTQVVALAVVHVCESLELLPLTFPTESPVLDCERLLTQQPIRPVVPIATPYDSRDTRYRPTLREVLKRTGTTIRLSRTNRICFRYDQVPDQ